MKDGISDFVMPMFVTSNANKLREFNQIMENFVFKSVNLDLTEIQGTPGEIIDAKSREASRLVNGPTIVEDVSLCFNALNSLPGPYIKTFLDKIGLNGMITLLNGYADKSAYAICNYAYCTGPDSDPIIFEGRTDGTIVEPRGKIGFGFDRIFQPVGFSQTYAEMTPEFKNLVSHRSKAINKLRKFLFNEFC
ncbi:MAG: non-canonical purine NTP pyrophosphatase [Cetobacterium sp.]